VIAKMDQTGTPYSKAHLT